MNTMSTTKMNRNRSRSPAAALTASPGALPAIPSRTSRPAANPPGETGVVHINAKAQLQVVLFKPISFGEETRAIADELFKAPHRGAQFGKDREGRLPPDCGLFKRRGLRQQRGKSSASPPTPLLSHPITWTSPATMCWTSWKTTASTFK